MTTPEGRVKMKINHILNKYGVWSFMPVPTGLQGKTIDYLCCHRGWFIGIEAKAPGKEPTGRQEYILGMIRATGGLTFVVSTDEDLHVLDLELGNINDRARHHQVNKVQTGARGNLSGINSPSSTPREETDSY